VVYVGGNQGSMFSVTAYANTWTSIDDVPHADSRIMVWDGTNIVRGDDGGVYELQSPGGGAAQRLTSINGNLAITEFNSIAYDSHAKELFGGTQDNGVPYQTGADNMTWAIHGQGSPFIFGDGNVEAVDNSGADSIRYSMANNPRQFKRLTYTNGKLTLEKQISLASAMNPTAGDFRGLNAADFEW